MYDYVTHILLNPLLISGRMKRKNELNWTKTSKKTRDYDARDDVTAYLDGVELGEKRHTASRDFETIVK